MLGLVSFQTQACFMAASGGASLFSQWLERTGEETTITALTRNAPFFIDSFARVAGQIEGGEAVAALFRAGTAGKDSSQVRGAFAALQEGRLRERFGEAMSDRFQECLERQLASPEEPVVSGKLNPRFLAGVPIRDYSHLEPGTIALFPLLHIIPTQAVVFISRVQKYLTYGYKNLPEVIILEGIPYVSEGHHRLITNELLGAGKLFARIHDSSGDPEGLVPMVEERMFLWELLVWKAHPRGPEVEDPRPYLRIP